jgi:uncharacterized peroxidase-related enzyme
MTRKPKLMALDAGPQDRLEPEIVDYFTKCEEKLGFVPNVFRAYAFDNAKLNAFILMADDLMLGESGLSKTEREMIAVAVSAINHCHYCLTSHGAALRQRGKDAELGELIAHNYRAAGLEPRQKAMLDFATRLTEAPDKIEETDRQTLRRAGFSDRDIWDIAAVASFYAMSNRMAAAADIKPNREYHYVARERTDGRAPAAAKGADASGQRGPQAPAPTVAAPASPRRRSSRGE